MTEKQPSRREREQTRHRREVLETALELFHQKGFSGAGVQEIAQAAEFGVGTLYRLFPGGKDEMLRELQVRVLAAFEEAMEGVKSRGGGPETELKGFIWSAAKIFATYPRELSLHLSLPGSPGYGLGGGLPPDLAQRFESSLDHLRVAVERGIEQGIFQAPEPWGAVQALRSMITGLFARSLADPLNRPLERAAAQIEAIFFRGILNQDQESRE